MLRTRAICQEGAAGIEIPPFEPRHELVRQRFALPDVNHTEPAEIAVFCAERTVDDGDLMDQFRD